MECPSELVGLSGPHFRQAARQASKSPRIPPLKTKSPTSTQIHLVLPSWMHGVSGAGPPTIHLVWVVAVPRIVPRSPWARPSTKQRQQNQHPGCITLFHELLDVTTVILVRLL
jgi:hypothetical protein